MGGSSCKLRSAVSVCPKNITYIQLQSQRLLAYLVRPTNSTYSYAACRVLPQTKNTQGPWTHPDTAKTISFWMSWPWQGLWGGIRILFGEELLTVKSLTFLTQRHSVQKVWLNVHKMPMSHGFVYAGLRTTCATIILTYARVGVWDSFTRHLRDLNCPKCAFPERNCLRGHLAHVDGNAYARAYAMHLSPKFFRQLMKPRVSLMHGSHITRFWIGACSLGIWTCS
jgi:hypothetical protein